MNRKLSRDFGWFMGAGLIFVFIIAPLLLAIGGVYAAAFLASHPR